MNEIELIKAASRRDKKAQAQLYDQYKRYWFTISLRYHNNRQDAEDSLQNALVKIYSKLEQFDPEKGSFKSWTAKIVVNENLMFLRDRQETVDLQERDVAISPGEIDKKDDTLSRENLTKMIRQLPEGYRTVFNLYVVEGYSHREIAKILDISEGTSKSQLHKARNLLQKQLEVLL